MIKNNVVEKFIYNFDNGGFKPFTSEIDGLKKRGMLMKELKFELKLLKIMEFYKTKLDCWKINQYSIAA